MLRRVAAPELRQMRCFGGDVRTERRAASGTRFDALSSNNLNASESDYTAKKNPNPRSYDGWSQACLFDCLHATKLMRGARLVRRSLRCTIVDALSEALTFGSSASYYQ